MKKLLTTLLLATGISLAVAQDSDPYLLSYQGRVADGAGLPIGNSTPDNRKVRFQVYSSATGGTAVYGEQQTITISGGEFSVLIGNGQSISSVSGPSNNTTIASILSNMSNKSLYLGVSVAGSDGEFASEISPRQQLVAGAFTFRAKVAETVTSQGVTASMLATGAVTSDKIAAGAVTLNSLGNASITSTKIADSTINAADIDQTSVGLWSPNGSNIFRSAGNVGIGTSTPAFLLDVNGDIRLDSGGAVRFYAPAGGYHGNPTGGMICYMAGSDYAHIYAAGYSNGGYLVINTGDDGNEPIVFQQHGVERMRIAANGYVGIGIPSPVAPLEVGGGFYYQGFGAAYAATNGYFTAAVSGPHGNHNFSIVSRAAILCDTYVFIASDERTKNIKGVSNGAADMQTLLGIEITDYTFRDSVARGNQTLKKVIAQQVEKVFPQAINKSTDVVPDIYQKSMVKDGWVQLPTDLKVGERVKLISEKTSGIYEVLEVKAGSFRTDFASEGGDVFVFGREVNDYRSVDYEALSMLNISATQQLKREKDAEIQSLRDENKGLRDTLALQEKRLATMEAADKSSVAKLTAIEKMLEGSNSQALHAVSLNAAK